MSRKRPKSCDLVRKQLFDLVRDPETSRPGVPGVEDHLKRCAACREAAEEIEGMLRARRSLADDLPGEVEDRVLLALRPEIQRQALRARRSAWIGKPVLLAGAAAAVALVVLVLWPLQRRVDPMRESAEPAHVTHSRGDVAVRLATGFEVRAVCDLERLSPGDTLKTGAPGRAAVRIGAERVVALESTAVVLRSLRRGDVHLELLHGVLVAEVERSGGANQRFWVSMPQGEVVVTGTVFQVETEGSRGEVSVVRGSVRVRLRDGRELDVPAGRSLVIDRESVQRSDLDAFKAGAARAALATETWGDQEQQRAVAALEESGDDPRERPLKRKGARSRARRVRVPERREAPCKHLVKLAGLAGKGLCTRAGELAAKLPERLDRADRGQALVMVADCHYGRGDLRTALRVYGRAARRFEKTAAGENALYETGRILGQIGKRAEAMRAFADYLDRYPKGALVSEALYRICTLAFEIGIHDKALSCLRRYRLLHPQTKRVGETYLLEATILRTEKGDCRGAIEAYDGYLRDPGEYAEQARRWRRWCREKLSGK